MGGELIAKLKNFKNNCSYIGSYSFQNYYYFFSDKLKTNQLDFINNCKIKLKKHKFTKNDVISKKILLDPYLFDDQKENQKKLKKQFKNFDEVNSLALLLKAYWAYKNENNGLAFRMIKEFLYFDPWDDLINWGLLNEENNEKLSINFEKLMLNLKANITSQNPEYWKLISLKLDYYLPDYLKKRIDNILDNSFSLQSVRKMSESALYGKPYFFLWVKEYTQRSSFREVSEYLKKIPWDYWEKSSWIIPYYFYLGPKTRKPFIKFLSDIKKNDLSLFYRIMSVAKYRGLILVDGKRAYPGFRAERSFYQQQLKGDKYFYYLFKLMQLGDLNTDYLF